MVFDSAWFAAHQQKLLWLLNTPLVGRWFKWVLRIRKSDVGYAKPVVQLLPHAYIVANEDGSFMADFRTHAKFAKRLYHAFFYLWLAFHVWDWMVADRGIPALSFGFSTLTAFPDANPETTSVDGVVDQFGLNTTWSTVRGSAGNFFDDTSVSQVVVKIVSSGTTNQWAELARGIFLFDTSALTAGAVVSDAVLSLFGVAGNTVDGLSITPDIDIYTSTPASNTGLANGDFAQVGAVSQTGTPIAFGSWNTAAYNDFQFNATGRSNVNVTGVSKFGTRNANYDVANVAPTWSASATSSIGAHHADETGSSQDPKLVVTFTIVSRFVPQNKTRPRPFAPGIAR